MVAGSKVRQWEDPCQGQVEDVGHQEEEGFPLDQWEEETSPLDQWGQAGTMVNFHQW